MARSDPAHHPAAARTGIAFGLTAYGLWGLMPLYFRLLPGVPATQMVAHRICWSLLFVGGLLSISRAWPTVATAVRNKRTALALLASAALISVNWVVYTWAVVNGHVLAASLGYYLNPLVNVALGTLVLRERLSRAGGGAVLLAALGVSALLFSALDTLWITLTLALSFSTYGLIRKVVSVSALPGLAIETALMLPVALGWLLTLGPAGAWGRDGATDALLVASGVVTAVPLLLFTGAARRLRYSTMGLLQFIAPTLQFLLAVFLFGELVTTGHVIAFGCIWAAVAIYLWDLLSRLRAGGDAGTGPRA